MDAKVDTGAPFCLFRRECAEDLDLRIEDRVPARVGTATGGVFRAVAHTVTLDVLGVNFETAVYFTEIPREIVQAAPFTLREPARPLVVRPPGVSVADVGREEVPEALRGLRLRQEQRRRPGADGGSWRAYFRCRLAGAKCLKSPRLNV